MTAQWAHPLSTQSLESICSVTTCERDRREAMAELERRDDEAQDATTACASCGTKRDAGGLKPNLTLSWEPIPGEFVCRDADACFAARYPQVPQQRPEEGTR